MEFSYRGKKLKGTLRVPSDKSISHRAIMLASLNKGTTVVKNFLRSEDCLNTLKAFKELGIDIKDGQEIKIKSDGKRSLKEPFNVLDLGNSGTSIRLISGILAGQPFYSVLTGDRYLRKRPMDRIAIPLRHMGAEIYGREGGKYPPLTIIGKKKLSGINYKSPKASAQVKSCILLAGLFTDEPVSITEPSKSRDHTERMLKAYGVEVIVEGLKVSLGKNRELEAPEMEINVPADISSAAFFMVGAAITPGSEVTLKDVILNETRKGILDVMERMGVNFDIDNKRVVSGETVGDVTVRFSPNLKGATIEGDEIPKLIDEIPVIALLASQAEGETIIKDASELRVKESDRIKSTVENLKNIGVDAEELPDGMIIRGKSKIKGGKVCSYGDHRIAMTFIVASLISEDKIEIDDINCISTSYPNFLKDLQELLN